MFTYFLKIDPGNCTNGDVRLADGIIDNEGRVEVCVNGVWGVVCDQGWGKTDAHVVCTQLGHPELGISAIIMLLFTIIYTQSQSCLTDLNLVLDNILLYTAILGVEDGRVN